MKLSNVAKLLVSVAIPFLIGVFGSFFTTADTLNNWYANLKKPPFNPPDWIFGPVWTTLYIMMGISAFLVWRKGLDDKVVRIALSCFIVQLALNAIWTPLFFGLHSPPAWSYRSRPAAQRYYCNYLCFLPNLPHRRHTFSTISGLGIFRDSSQCHIVSTEPIIFVVL